MKRKIFSKLLMGAFLIASVSAFVSCKDYDDDINANKAEIKAVQDQLATLTGNLNSLKTELQTQKTALEQELATAKSQLETQIAEAKAALNSAIEKKADQSSVDALASKVATLESNLAALNAAYEAKMSAIDSALASLQAIIDKKADITYVDNAIAILSAAVDGKVAKEDFGAFKSEVNTLQNDLNNLTALVNTKADQKDIDHAVEKINEKLAQLVEQMKTTVPQSDIANIQETIKALQASVNSLTQAVAAKAEQSAVDQLNAFYKELKEQVNTLVTPEQLASAIQTLKEEVATKGAEESARLEGLIAQVQKAVDENKAAGEKALKDAVEEINTALGTKASVDDLDKVAKEFKAAKETIEKDIATKYAAVTGDIEKTNKLIEDINKALTAEIAKKADLADFNKFKQDFANLKLDERVIACEALIEQVAAINAYLGKLAEGATLAKTLEDLKTVMSKDAADKVAAEAKLRTEAIAEVNKTIADLQTDLNKQIADANKAQAALENKLYGEGEAAGDIDKLQADTKKLTEDFSKIDEKIQTGIDKNLANLKVFVQHMLTSITLIPQLYIDGIEAIQFLSVEYMPQAKDYSITPDRYQDAENYQNYWISNGTTPEWQALAHHQLVNLKNAKKVLVDNGETEAYYRVSPAVVKEEEIDVDKIKFACTTAETVTRGATIKDNDPVIPTFSSLDKGVLTVKLTKKDKNQNLRFAGEGNKANIASLMVPRKENKEKNVEYQEIYSEYNLIDELTISPRIAALNKVNRDIETTKNSAKNYVFNGSNWWDKHDPKVAMQYHFIDSAKIWRAQVDKNVWVKEEIQFDQPFDLMWLVTGCYEIAATGTAGTVHKEITKADLAKYGLEFRFYVPKKEYGDPELVNYNFTDQQRFAKIDGSMISATLPSGAEALGNRAIIGKEPIVRVELIDVNNKSNGQPNLVDMAYFKVKFVDKTPKKPAIEITKEKEQTLACEGDSLVIKWAEFIEDLYAQMEGTYGTGLSWQEFRAVYPATDVVRAGKDANNNYPFAVTYGSTGSVKEINSYRDYTAQPKRDAYRLGDVNIKWLSGDAKTESPAADANELKWKLNADDMYKILPAREKTYTTKVIFVSNRPTDYGNIELTLKLKVKMPDVPELTYYENYWYDKYNAHYVLPVQYNTKAYYEQLIGETANNSQYKVANIRPSNKYIDEKSNNGAYCVYNNNLFNAFTFNQDEFIDAAKKIRNKYYNTPIPTIANYNCAEWDFQFRLSQPQAGMNAVPQYYTPTATEPLTTAGVAGIYSFGTQYKADDIIENFDGAAFGGYNLQTKFSGEKLYRDAIWMNWYNDDKDTNGDKEPGTVISGDGSWSWNNADGASRPYLFADHFNLWNQYLINPIASNGVGKAPTFSNNKKVKVAMFIAWNQYNVEVLKSYDICLVAPLDINANLKGFFEEGLVSGSFVNCAGAFTMVDFRGYEVAKEAAKTAAEKANEFQKYRDRLFNYYECEDPVFDLTKIKYGMKLDKGNIVVDNTVTVSNVANEGKGLTSAQIEQYTNGNVVLSVEQFNPDGVADTQWLRFKNNGGSNVEDEVNVFIPATMQYGFGTVTKYVQIKLYPRGNAPASARLR
jgi:predicted  nucleic acid-binding Zn-ribbon protein